MRKLVLLLVILLSSQIVKAATLPSSTTYEVDLSWSAPTDQTDTVSGYNIYREQSSSFSLLFSNDSSTTYTDSSLLYGVSYNYYVTSVDANSVESVPSNTVTVAIPFVPYTPVMGSVVAL